MFFFAVSKSTDLRLLEVAADTERIAFRTPIKFGGRVVTDAVLFNVTVEVETRDGRRGMGVGSMPMGNVWAWPSKRDQHRAIAGRHGRAGPAARPAGRHITRAVGHPLDITHELAARSIDR